MYTRLNFKIMYFFSKICNIILSLLFFVFCKLTDLTNSLTSLLIFMLNLDNNHFILYIKKKLEVCKMSKRNSLLIYRFWDPIVHILNFNIHTKIYLNVTVYTLQLHKWTIYPLWNQSDRTFFLYILYILVLINNEWIFYKFKMFFFKVNKLTNL